MCQVLCLAYYISFNLHNDLRWRVFMYLFIDGESWPREAKVIIQSHTVFI